MLASPASHCFVLSPRAPHAPFHQLLNPIQMLGLRHALWLQLLIQHYQISCWWRAVQPAASRELPCQLLTSLAGRA